MNLVEYLDKITDNLFEPFFIYFENRKDLKRVNCLAREYSVPKTLIDNFFNYFKLLKTQCFPSKKHGKLYDKANIPEVKFNTLLLLRVYQLTNEFMKATSHEMTHSCLALTRSMYELLILVIYSSHNPEAIEVISNEQEHDLRCARMINKLKSQKVQYFVKQMNEYGEISRIDIIPELYADYEYLSKLIHSFKKETYMSNILYSMDSSKDEAIILGNWFLSYNDKRFIVFKFISYMNLAVQDLENIRNKILYEE